MDIIDYNILGDDMQVVEIELDPREGVQAEVGAMLYMENNIKMMTSTGGGILKGFKKMLTGESFFITSFINEGIKREKVAFSSPIPGKIIPIDLRTFGGQFICQKDSFLCAAKGVDIDVAFTKKLGTGFFGGEGFILQKLQGDGLAFINSCGTVIEKRLEAGEILKVDTGCIVGFSPGIYYDIQFVGGFKNVLFGGEGLFLANLTGPGIVYLQSMPFSKLVDRIYTSMPNSYGKSKGGFNMNFGDFDN